MFIKPQPCKMSCRIPCDFGKCHEVSDIGRVLNASNKSLSWRGKEIFTIAAEPQVTKHKTAGWTTEAEDPKLFTAAVHIPGWSPELTSLLSHCLTLQGIWTLSQWMLG